MSLGAALSLGQRAGWQRQGTGQHYHDPQNSDRAGASWNSRLRGETASEVPKGLSDVLRDHAAVSPTALVLKRRQAAIGERGTPLMAGRTLVQRFVRFKAFLFGPVSALNMSRAWSCSMPGTS
jgi:hypothetical protein